MHSEKNKDEITDTRKAERIIETDTGKTGKTKGRIKNVEENWRRKNKWQKSLIR